MLSKIINWFFPVWQHRSAVRLINQLQPIARQYGCCLGLTGSVLYQGKSSKDLDIVVFPFQTRTQSPDFYGFRSHLLWKGVINRRWQYRTPHHPHDTKEVWFARINGKRVDFFFLQ